LFILNNVDDLRSILSYYIECLNMSHPIERNTDWYPIDIHLFSYPLI